MDIVARAVRVLMHDGLVVYPTETVYGLGADALSEEAVLRVFEAKGRPAGKPISVAVADFGMAAAIAVIDPPAEDFMRRFLPGPVTVVLEAKSCLPELLTGGTGMIGIRIPAHEIPLRITQELDAPITATSANLAGDRDPVRPDQVRVPHDLLIDGGVLPGTPSTVVDLPARRVLRRGALADDVERFLEV